MTLLGRFVVEILLSTLSLFLKTFIELCKIFALFLLEHFWVENIFKEVEVLLSIKIKNSSSSWSHVSHIYVISLFYKFSESSTHRNNIIIRVRWENKYILGLFRDLDNILIKILYRLILKRPCCNLLAYFPIHIQIQVLNLTIGALHNEVSQVVILVVLILQAQYWLVKFLRKPYNTVQNPILWFGDDWVLGVSLYGPGMCESL